MKNQIKKSTKIMLDVENELYYDIKNKADKDTMITGTKKTIAEKICEMLKAQNKLINMHK